MTQCTARWMSLAEMRAKKVDLYPNGLAELLSAPVEGSPPSRTRFSWRAHPARGVEPQILFLPSSGPSPSTPYSISSSAFSSAM